MIEREYKEGDIIIEEGDASDFAYQILSGEVEIFVTRDGQKVVLGMMKEGEFLGEMGIVDGQPRSASALAKSRVSVAILEREEFFNLISRDNVSAYRLISRLCEHLRKANRMIAEISVSAEDVASGGGTLSPPPHQVADSDGSTGAAIALRVDLFPLSQKPMPGLPAEGINLANLPFSVGRLPLGNEPLPRRSIDLKIPDSRPFRLSREHFAFYHNPQGVFVVDLGSTLGTQVNGELLGHDFSKDFVCLKRGENKIFAGGIDSPFTFRAVVEEA